VCGVGDRVLAQNSPEGPAEPAAAENVLQQLLKPAPSAAFASGSVFLWNGRIGVAFDVESELWSQLPDGPGTESAVDAKLLALSNGHVVAACFADDRFGELRVDEYAPEKREWSVRARIPRFVPGGARPKDWSSLDAVVEVEGDLLFFIGGLSSQDAAKGLLLRRSGDWRFISSEEAPEGSDRRSLAYCRGEQVLYATYRLFGGSWGVWNHRSNEWSESGTTRYAYDRGQCFTGVDHTLPCRECAAECPTPYRHRIKDSRPRLARWWR